MAFGVEITIIVSYGDGLPDGGESRNILGTTDPGSI